MREHCRLSGTKAHDVPADRSACSWEDVIEAIETAQAEDDTKMQKNKTLNIQKTRALVVSLELLADMIPDQNGLSVLRGGLKFLFKLIQKRIDNRGTILRTFEDIPITFSRACEAAKIHPDDALLQEHVRNLCDTLLMEIPKLSAILLRRHKGSLPTRLFKQHPEQESISISNCLELVSRASYRVTTRVDILNDKIAVTILRETEAVQKTLTETQTGIHQALTSIKSSNALIDENYRTGMREHSTKLDALADLIDRKIQSVTIGLRGELQALRSLLLVAVEQSSPLQPSTKHMQAEMPVNTAWNCSENVSCVDILKIIQVTDASFVADDVEYSIRVSNQLRGLDRGGWLLVTDRFRFWAQRPESDLILVNGHLGDISAGKVSPLSGICALFAGMRVIPQAAILHHFCGLHSNTGESLNGPRGLMQSIIMQLVLYLDQQHCGNPVYLRLGHDLLQVTQTNDIFGLCFLFQQLISQLPNSLTVYCLMDNVSEFETSLRGWDDELSQIVSFLRGILLERRSGPRLKVLMTSPHKSISLCRQVSPEDQISLSAQNRLPATGQIPAFEERLYAVMSTDGR